MKYIRLCLCAAGFFTLSFFHNIYAAWLVAACFLALCLICKRKVHLLSAFFITLSVTFFSLIIPEGKVLCTLGSWRITQDALFDGLYRSAVLNGMVFISQCALSKQPTLPGKAGTFLSQTLAYFSALTAQKFRVKKQNLVTTIDEILLQLWNED